MNTDIKHYWCIVWDNLTHGEMEVDTGFLTREEADDALTELAARFPNDDFYVGRKRA
jgi:hypothetical protein